MGPFLFNFAIGIALLSPALVQASSCNIANILAEATPVQPGSWTYVSVPELQTGHLPQMRLDKSYHQALFEELGPGSVPTGRTKEVLGQWYEKNGQLKFEAANPGGEPAWTRNPGQSKILQSKPLITANSPFEIDLRAEANHAQALLRLEKHVAFIPPGQEIQIELKQPWHGLTQLKLQFLGYLGNGNVKAKTLSGTEMEFSLGSVNKFKRATNYIYSGTVYLVR
jgi:hypothetical protein